MKCPGGRGVERRGEEGGEEKEGEMKMEEKRKLGRKGEEVCEKRGKKKREED